MGKKKGGPRSPDEGERGDGGKRLVQRRPDSFQGGVDNRRRSEERENAQGGTMIWRESKIDVLDGVPSARNAPRRHGHTPQRNHSKKNSRCIYLSLTMRAARKRGFIAQKEKYHFSSDVGKIKSPRQGVHRARRGPAPRGDIGSGQREIKAEKGSEPRQ